MMFRRTADEDESASDWDDLSSKESVRASVTPTSAAQPHHNTRTTTGRNIAIGDAVHQNDYSSARAQSENSSNGIQSQPQIAVELSHTPGLDQHSRTSQSSPHPVFSLTSPVAGEAAKSFLNVEVPSNMEPTPIQTFLHPNSPKTTKSPGKRSEGTEEAKNSDKLKPNSPVLSLHRSHDPPHLFSSRSHNPPIPTMSSSQGPPLPVKLVESPRNLPGIRPHDQRALYAVQEHGNRQNQTDPVGHVTKLEEMVGEEDESNAFGIPEEMNMTVSEDILLKKPTRLDLEFSSVAVDKVDTLTPSHYPPHAYMGLVADRWEKLSKRGVEEIFSLLRLATDLLIAILLGSAHCLFHHLIRKLVCGLGHLFADSIYKPFLTLCFNGFMWPCLQVCAQLSKGLVIVIKPLLEVLGVLFSWLAHVCRSVRLVNLTYKTYQTPSHDRIVD